MPIICSDSHWRDLNLSAHRDQEDSFVSFNFYFLRLCIYFSQNANIWINQTTEIDRVFEAELLLQFFLKTVFWADIYNNTEDCQLTMSRRGIWKLFTTFYEKKSVSSALVKFRLADDILTKIKHSRLLRFECHSRILLQFST